MPANIKEFVIVNNYGNLFTGDNLRDTSFTASKTYSGSTGPTYIDVVTVIGTATNLCLNPGDTVTTTYTKGPATGISTSNASNINTSSANITGTMQSTPNTGSLDSVPDL
ncbi:hypothetical protein QUF88_24595 [Bacillus sp. DX1.1]|uniref:hypothetical protein n=1 Tax=unclassified Bacillus (in: firmicutes) TaxID=185979 RepID=UPI00257080C1|nr:MULTISPECIES: hypothetical protein [unclassified Bacillus (in: firmicutes)]MDM5156893.1 hypothetical protein [Bacillus sp. DX1.1]WJE81138.1 hypothetical protein QRE67_22135 [Bacillus sp. DX3.1]